MRIDPRSTDPQSWGHSFVNLAELTIPCLEAAGARSVVEVGAYAGDLTGFLLEWAARVDGTVTAVDPTPQEELVRLHRERPDLELVRETSLDALRRLPLPDAFIIDGDHNHHTVLAELRTIAERAQDATLPLLLFHDVGWPHGRRDAYYAPERIPDEHRQPITEGGGLLPWEPGTQSDGLRYKYPAAREGGARNGVLTAIEDFVAEREGLRLVVVPAFFGFGAVWDTRAPWAGAVAEVLDPWDRHPLLERLEANRVFHLATHQVLLNESAHHGAAVSKKDELLWRLLQSRSFALAERISRLRQRGEPAISRQEVRRVLED